MLVINILNRYGAEAARQAHNLQVIGSKPIVGICFFWVYNLSPLLQAKKRSYNKLKNSKLVR